MGYYSQVAIKAEEEIYKEIMEVIKRYDHKPNVVKEEVNSDIVVYVIFWPYIKWYWDMPETIDEILEKYKDVEQKGFNYCFLRFGEDIDDVERKESSGNTMYIDWKYSIII